MLIGLDFDNTLANYDKVFKSLAIEKNLIPNNWLGDKSSLKEYLFEKPNGEFSWQKLQGQVYGKYMHQADLFVGVKDFLKNCKIRSLPVCIVSHKTIYGIHDRSKVLLRKQALLWMRKKKFFSELGLSENDVYFETTLEDKIKRINQLECSHFIDDLEEVLMNSSLSKTINKIHFSANTTKKNRDIVTFDNWRNFPMDYFF